MARRSKWMWFQTQLSADDEFRILLETYASCMISDGSRESCRGIQCLSCALYHGLQDVSSKSSNS